MWRGLHALRSAERLASGALQQVRPGRVSASAFSLRPPASSLGYRPLSIAPVLSEEDEEDWGDELEEDMEDLGARPTRGIRPLLMGTTAASSGTSAKGPRISPFSVDETLAILDACLRNGNLVRAEKLYAKLAERKFRFGIKVYHAFIEEYGNAGQFERSLGVLDLMKQDGVQPTTGTFVNLLKAAFGTLADANLKRVLQAMLQHNHAITSIPDNSFFTEAEQRLLRLAVDSLVEEQPDALSVTGAGDKLDTLPFAISKIATDGVQEMRKNLSVLMRRDLDRYHMQEELESLTSELARDRLDRFRSQNINTGLRNERLNELLFDWKASLRPALMAELQRIQDEVPGNGRELYGPFLLLLPPDTILDALFAEFMSSYNLGVVGAIKISRAMAGMGQALENAYNSMHLRRHRKRLNLDEAKFQQMMGSGRIFNMQIRKMASEYQTTLQDELGTWQPKWPVAIKVRVGAVMLQLLLDHAKLELFNTTPTGQQDPTSKRIVPAWYHSYIFVGGKKIGVVKPHPHVERMFADIRSIRDIIPSRMLPMLVPPRPWLTFNTGGYLTIDRPCLRLKESPEQLKLLRVASRKGRLTNVLTALDVLGHTAWKVNDRVLDVAMALWEAGGGVADIPAREDMVVPELPTGDDVTPFERRSVVVQRRKADKHNRELHALRCDVNYKLEIANAFKGQAMYFPHTVDFRGRAYPIPPHLNHLGSDICRGLLAFHEKRPLGDRGLFWLKVHLGNLAGYDKLDFDGRVAKVDEMRDRILAVAEDPLKNDWWKSSDDPWQLLATCLELAGALQSPDPTAFESSLPVHQDGSCNGLQHYAALGGDRVGAEAVNLVHTDQPQDVYSAVATIVAQFVAKDAEEAKDPLTRDIARRLNGKVSRKIVKQTVMTNVYGVTFVGARQQIENRLVEAGTVPEEMIYKASVYLTRLTFQSLGEMFNGAREIQNWLTETAREVARSRPAANVQEEYMAAATKKDVREQGETLVVWTTPLDLPIVQPYRKKSMKQIYTNLQSIQVDDPVHQKQVNVNRQKSAFPPNFIHSLDSTHMLMTALACTKDTPTPLVFASVHDSFWTHASSVDQMNTAIREQFVALHSQPIMDNLRNEFLERYRDHVVFEKAIDDASLADIPDVQSPPKDGQAAVRFSATAGWRPIQIGPIPQRGEFDVNEVKKSAYFFD